MSGHILATAFTVILMVLGLFGSLIPFLPGPPLAWTGLLVYAVATHFAKVSVTAVLAFAILTVIILIFEMFSPALVAKGYKATRAGAWGAFLGAILGVFFLGPFGVVLGPFVGAFVGEILGAQSQQHALRSAWGAFVGFLLGSALKIIATLAIVGYFVYKLF